MRIINTRFLPKFGLVAALSIGASGVIAQTSGTAPLSPAQLSASFADVAKTVGPAVVNIDTKGRIPETASRGQASPGGADDIMDFFRRQLPRRPSYSVGSGFIVDRAGYIVTNHHVVEDAARIVVKLASGEEFPARVLGSDTETDIAVIKIDAGRDLPFVRLGDSDEARVGDWVLAVGSPFGLSRSVTAGIVSQTKRETPSGSPFQKFIQTDAAINRGNSGGPLVNLKGEVIGVNSQIATSTGDYNGVGFALPSNEVRNVYEQIVASGKVRRGFLGVGLDSVKAEYAAVYGLPEAKGAILTRIQPGESAEAAGLRSGDVIVAFNGEPVASAQDLIEKVASVPPDRTVSVQYLRENTTGLERRTASITLGVRPVSGRVESDTTEVSARPVDRPKESTKPFGLTLADVTPAMVATYKLEGQKGVVVKEISPESFITDVKAGNGADALDEGDVIQRINRVPVADAKSFTDAVNRLKKGDPVVLHVLAVNPASKTTQLKIVQFTVQ